MRRRAPAAAAAPEQATAGGGETTGGWGNAYMWVVETTDKQGQSTAKGYARVQTGGEKREESPGRRGATIVCARACSVRGRA